MAWAETFNEVPRLPRRAGTCLVTAFPIMSGHGQIAVRLYELGFFEKLLFFKLRRNDVEEGYGDVVRPRIPLSYISAFLSLYFPGRWSRAVSGATWVHFNSPHFFDLSRFNPRASGTIHDLLWTDRVAQRFRDNPLGSHFYFSRELRYADRLKGVVVISHVVQSALQARLPKTDSTVIHNWVGEEFRPRNKEGARERLGIPPGRRVLLHVSIDNVRKNIEILPKILDMLGPRYVLVRIGDSKRIAHLFQPHQLIARERVRISDYSWYFNAADALVFPSFSEGFGIPLAEAICSGLPVIASDIPIFRELLPKSYPFFANPSVPNSWKEPIQTAVEAGLSDPYAHKLYGELPQHFRRTRAIAEYREFFQRIAKF